LDRPTISVYEAHAEAWTRARRPRDDALRRALQLRDPLVDGWAVDLGCGPGWQVPALARPRAGLDAVRAFLVDARRALPGEMFVQGDLARLPFATGSVSFAWAQRSYVHLPRAEVPLALRELHRVVAPGGTVGLGLFVGDLEFGPLPDDEFPGRRFSSWPTPLLTDVLTGAGFEILRFEVCGHEVEVVARRSHSLPDTVGADMRLLVVGLNPSPTAARLGVGFSGPGNRFWPAALAAGLITVERDPVAALVDRGVGMTDLVKRVTARAADLTVSEYEAGFARLERLASWLRPAVVCVVGLAGWRRAIDRRATPGPQRHRIGGRPTYLMPNPSGLNAHVTVEVLASHLRAAADLAADP
jgi:TDG/mug DNA glycosylase family protein